jgi:hypothetical protein
MQADDGLVFDYDPDLHWETRVYYHGRFLYAVDDFDDCAVACPVCRAPCTTYGWHGTAHNGALRRPELLAAAANPVVSVRAKAACIPADVWGYVCDAASAAVPYDRMRPSGVRRLLPRALQRMHYYVAATDCRMVCDPLEFLSGYARGARLLLTAAYTPFGSFVVIECPTSLRVGVVCSWGAVYSIPASARPILPRPAPRVHVDSGIHFDNGPQREYGTVAFARSRFLYTIHDQAGILCMCPHCHVLVSACDPEHATREFPLVIAVNCVEPVRAERAPLPPRVWHHAVRLAAASRHYSGCHRTFPCGEHDLLGQIRSTPLLSGDADEATGTLRIAEAATPWGSFCVFACPHAPGRCYVLCSWGAVYDIPRSAWPTARLAPSHIH